MSAAPSHHVQFVAASEVDTAMLHAERTTVIAVDTDNAARALIDVLDRWVFGADARLSLLH